MCECLGAEDRAYADLRADSIYINLPKGSEGSSQESGPPTFVTANPVKYATIRMDGKELTN